MTNNDILGCLRIQFSYNTNYLTQSFVESRYFSEILKRQSKYVRNSSSTMVIEQYWAWFNQSIGEGVHGETYRIAGIQLEEWKKRGHRHGISQNLTKERGNNVLLLFFWRCFCLDQGEKGWESETIFCGRTVGFRMRKVGDVCYWPSIFGIPNLDTWLSCRCALTTPGIEPTQNSWNTQERGCNKQHVWWT